MNEVQYIGHKLTAKGVQISDEKVRTVLKMPEPRSIANVQTLPRKVTYMSKFLPNLSEVTEPLKMLIQESHAKDFQFHLDEIHPQTFEKLKKMMTSAPGLKYYSSSEPKTILCNAFQSGIGAVLLQNGQPVHYASKVLTKTKNMCMPKSRKNCLP